jgi:hypothetical protein
VWDLPCFSISSVSVLSARSLMSAKMVRLAPLILVLIEGLNPAIKMMALFCSQVLDPVFVLTWLITVVLTGAGNAVHNSPMSAGSITSGILMRFGLIFVLSSHKILLALLKWLFTNSYAACFTSGSFATIEVAVAFAL